MMDVRSYYQQITGIDIGVVARTLFGERIVEENSQRLHVDCPQHASESRRSLHVDLSKGLWHCFGCQVGGDVIQLVEFVRTGQITKGVTGKMTDSHRAARDYLGEMISLPPLHRAGLSPEDVARMEQRRLEAERVFAALTILTDIYHHALLDSPEVMTLIAEQWGFGEKTVRDYRIGYANTPDVIAQLKQHGVDERTALSTGAFVVDTQDHALPFFQKRIVFPYHSRGRVVYMIGRRTPWTHQRDLAKYKKLQVHHPDLKKFVSPAVDNSILFGEDILASAPSEVSITEGITDAIATQDAGFPCISPVTVGFKRADVERLVKRLRGVKRVYIIQDNEFSGVGMKGALATARILNENGIESRVGLIPVPHAQQEARDELAALMGEDLTIKVRNADPTKRAKMLDLELPEKDRARARELRAKSKVDLCDWWMQGGTQVEYQKMLDESRTVMHVAITQAPKIDGEKARQIVAIEPLLTEIGLAPPAERDDMLRLLKESVGLSLSLLRPEAARLARKARDEARNEKKGAKASSVLAALSDATSGSLKEMLSTMVQAAQANQVPVSWEKMGREAFEWFRSNGAIFFRSYGGTPYLFFESRVLCQTAAGGGKTMFEGFMFHHSGFVPISSGARTFFAVIRSMTVEYGDVRELPTWLQTFVEDRTTYVNLNNAENQIVAITSDGWRVGDNGKNPHRSILSGTSKFEPVVPTPSVDHRNLEDRWRKLIGRHLATDDLSRRAIFAWTVLFPLLGYVGTRPMIRFEGAPGSGKTWGAKMLTTLVYGDDQQKKATTAANYVDASANPLVALDNVEMTNANPDLIDFLLTVVTGIRREKRKGNTDTETVSEQPMCLLMTTGVEPLGGDLAEIMSRTFVIPFFVNRQDEALVERDVLAQIKTRRNELLSLVFARCAAVTRLIDEHDGMNRAMVAIKGMLGAHSKRRCDEWLAMMYLVTVAAQPDSRTESMLDDLTPAFGAMISSMNEESEEVSRESSPTVAVLSSLFNILRSGGKTAAQEYGIEMNDERTKMIDVGTRELFVALRSISKTRNLPFPYSNTKQFGRRFALEMEALDDEGLSVERRTGAARKKFFTITTRRLSPVTDFVEDTRPTVDMGDLDDAWDVPMS